MVELAYLAAGVGPMSLVVIIGLWGDRRVTPYRREILVRDRGRASEQLGTGSLFLQSHRPPVGLGFNHTSHVRADIVGQQVGFDS